ncbi:MAG: type II toxin-antitoxin system HipA family toxin [Bacteroidia bacterium]
MILEELNNCPGTLKEGFNSYSPACRRKLFMGRSVSHVLPFLSPGNEGEDQLKFLENRKRISISGVQEKITLYLEKNKFRFPSENESGQYILKPIPRDLLNVSQVPANEHLTMQIAEQVFKIKTAPNALIFFKDNIPAYITKRFDIRDDGSRNRMEDFASLAQKTEENEGKDFKYNFSYLGIAELIKKYVPAYMPELERFYTLVLFNYLFSNGDAHLKNFSLIETQSGDFLLAPAYDLICTRIHVDDEDMGLKDGLYENDFEHPSYAKLGFYAYDDLYDFGLKIGLIENRIQKILFSFSLEQEIVISMIDHSFFNSECKLKYKELYLDKLKRFKLSSSGRI